MEDGVVIEDGPEASFLEDQSSAALNLSSIHRTARAAPCDTTLNRDLERDLCDLKRQHKADLDELRRDVATLKTSHTALQDRCMALEAENVALHERVFALQDRNSVQITQLTAELDEKKRREKNLILTGLPEASKRYHRGSKDREAVLRALSTIRPETTIDDLGHVSRLGGKSAGKIRPVKVVLKSPELARNVLKLARRKSVQGVKVLRDRTPAEQDVLEALRKELEERRVTDDSLTIRFANGIPQIVSVRPGNARRQH